MLVSIINSVLIQPLQDYMIYSKWVTKVSIGISTASAL